MISARKIWTRRSILIITGGAFIFLLTALMLLRVINDRSQSLNVRMLQELSAEKALLIQKEFDILDQNVFLIQELANTGDYNAIDHLIGRGRKGDFIMAYQVWSPEGRKLHHSWSAKGTDLANLLPSEILQGSPSMPDSVILVKTGQSLYVSRGYALKDKNLRVYIDLLKLNEYFMNSKLSVRAYFELYDVNGWCLIHPDIKKVGQRDVKKISMVKEKQDTVLMSDYINLKVLVQKYKIEGILGPTEALISVLFLLTDEDIEGIGHLSLFLGLTMLGVVLLLSYILYRERQKIFRLEMEGLHHQKEEAVFKLERLREKMDPHFLFNTLGTLQQLIKKDSELAQTFVSKLSKVYRRFLTQDDGELSPIATELALAEEYFFLQKIRFGAGLQPLDVQVGQDIYAGKIPKLGLQMLIENAIKHNEISTTHPLSIKIEVEDGRIVVVNTLNLRRSADESNGYGIPYLKNVYKYHGVEGFEVIQSGHAFKVYLPIL